MAMIDMIARADLAQTKVQIHQMTAALYMGIDALDIAFKCVERIVDNIAGDDMPEAVAEDLKTLRDARAKILQMHLNLR